MPKTKMMLHSLFSETGILEKCPGNRRHVAKGDCCRDNTKTYKIHISWWGISFKANLRAAPTNVPLLFHFWPFQSSLSTFLLSLSFWICACLRHVVLATVNGVLAVVAVALPAVISSAEDRLCCPSRLGGWGCCCVLSAAMRVYVARHLDRARSATSERHARAAIVLRYASNFLFSQNKCIHVCVYVCMYVCMYVGR